MKKICNKCNKGQELSNFRKDKKGLNGLRSICKKCESLYMRKRYIEKREYLLYKQKEYQSTEKGKELSRLKRQKRRKLVKLTNNNSINYKTIKNKLLEQNNKCIYCNKNINKHESRHLDHIQPLSKGGKHIIENVQWLCCKCNLYKSNKTGFILNY